MLPFIAVIQASNTLSLDMRISVKPAELAVEHVVPQARIAGLASREAAFTVGNGRVSV